MIRQRIVFVIGAGASHPYGFPLGTGLVDATVTGTGAIANRLCTVLMEAGNDYGHIRAFHTDLAASRPRSIDQFLRRRPEYATVGKQAIVQQLLLCEDASVVAQCKSDADWLTYLTSTVLCGETLDDVLANNVTFVTFNFDRLLEFRLTTWLSSTYGVSVDLVADILRKFGVIHVHGKLGALPWLAAPDELQRHFQPDNYDGRDVAKFAEQLHIIGDGVDDEPTDLVSRALSAADQVCFVGFGYDRTNMGWLQKCGLDKSLGRYGTRLGLTDAEARPATEAGIMFPAGVDADAKAFLRRHTVLHDA